MRVLVKSLFTIILILSINSQLQAQCSPDSTMISDTICVGDSALVFGQYRSIGSVYIDTFQNSIGCDSLIFLDLIVDGYSPQYSGSYQQNGDFETWFIDSITCDSITSSTYEYAYFVVPISDFFNTFGSYSCNYDPLIQRSNDAFTGEHALKLRYDTGSLYSSVPNGIAVMNFENRSGRPKYLHGAYKFNGGPNDSLVVLTQMFRDNSWNTSLPDAVIGNVQKGLGNTGSNYVEFTIPIEYDSIANVDSMAVNFALFGSNGIIEATIDNVYFINDDALIDTTICAGDSILFAGQYYSSAGNYFDTSIATSGCDSILQLSLRVEAPFAGQDSIEICFGDSILIGGVFRSISGTYIDSIASTSGCGDSVITYFLNIKPLNSSTTLNPIACDSYLSPAGNTYTSTGLYSDTLNATDGCDSIISINLVIRPSTSSSISGTACGSYISPSGKTFLTSGIYSDTIPNSLGCDSVISINLIVNQPSSSSITTTACDSYISPGGKEFTSSGTYIDTVANGLGCDSLITINLTVNNSDSSGISVSSCGDYLSAGGNTYTSSGTYVESFQNVNGCDSSVTINLTVTRIDTSISPSANGFEANQAGAAYQWFDCDNDELINGETQKEFLFNGPQGRVAVIIELNGCVDTSNCKYWNIGGIAGLVESEILLYPNPTDGFVILRGLPSDQNLKLDLQNSQGQLLQTSYSDFKEEISFTIDQESGVYYLIISDLVGNRETRLIIKK